MSAASFGDSQGFFESFYQDFRVGDETHLFRLWGDDCVRHLFRVVSGLESMLVGETEIFGQVKRAYECASGAKTTSKLPNRLFQKSDTIFYYDHAWYLCAIQSRFRVLA